MTAPVYGDSLFDRVQNLIDQVNLLIERVNSAENSITILQGVVSPATNIQPDTRGSGSIPIPNVTSV